MSLTNAAFIVAAKNGHIDIVRRHLTGRIDVNKADTKYDMTALMWAATNGHTEIVRALLTAPGIDVNKADDDGLTALRPGFSK